MTEEVENKTQYPVNVLRTARVHIEDRTVAEVDWARRVARAPEHARFEFEEPVNYGWTITNTSNIVIGSTEELGKIPGFVIFTWVDEVWT